MSQWCSVVLVDGMILYVVEMMLGLVACECCGCIRSPFTTHSRIVLADDRVVMTMMLTTHLYSVHKNKMIQYVVVRLKN